MFWAAFAGLFLGATTAHADFTMSCLGHDFHVPGDTALDTVFEGTLMITTPTGELFLVNQGEALPPVPPGSTIEVFKGSAGIQVGGASALAVTCEKDLDNVGEAKILTGGITVTDPLKHRTDLAEGIVYPIRLVEAPATAAAEPEGTEAEDLPPVDSRNVPQSP